MSLLLDTLGCAAPPQPVILSAPAPEPPPPEAPAQETTTGFIGSDLYRLPNRTRRITFPLRGRSGRMTFSPPQIPDPLPRQAIVVEAARAGLGWRSVGRTALLHGLFLGIFLYSATIDQEPAAARHALPPDRITSAPTLTMACFTQPGEIRKELFTPTTPPAPAVGRATIPTRSNAKGRENPPAPVRMPERAPEPKASSPTLAALHTPARIETEAPASVLTRPTRPARYLFLSNQPPLLTQARKALLAGDLTTARRHYDQALHQQPGHPTALAGLAALAIRDRQLDRARTLYRELSHREPHSILALAGLSALDPNPEIETLEQRLRQLAGSTARTMPLQFVLGNRLAARQEWPAARDAFRAALQQDGANPDLHHNLAIALDRLGDRRAALEHYREALRVATLRGWAGFDPERIRRRAAILETKAVEG
ncbi:MAG: tetratricopeptide repeat protein [Magnetococcales bacterium]|nr:tetratricopeptide repeat protein [Magnetococcales bacterium]